MTLNGTDLKTLGITPLKGATDNLYGAIGIKSLKYNDNAQMDGSRAIVINKKVKRRDNIAFPCFIAAATRQAFLTKVNELYEMLDKGLEDESGHFTGVNELADDTTKFKLVCAGYSSLRSWQDGRGTINFIFTELNPNNRS